MFVHIRAIWFYPHIFIFYDLPKDIQWSCSLPEVSCLRLGGVPTNTFFGIKKYFFSLTRLKRRKRSRILSGSFETRSSSSTSSSSPSSSRSAAPAPTSGATWPGQTVDSLLRLTPSGLDWLSIRICYCYSGCLVSADAALRENNTTLLALIFGIVRLGRFNYFKASVKLCYSC